MSDIPPPVVEGSEQQACAEEDRPPCFKEIVDRFADLSAENSHLYDGSSRKPTAILNPVLGQRIEVTLPQEGKAYWVVPATRGYEGVILELDLRSQDCAKRFAGDERDELAAILLGFVDGLSAQKPDRSLPLLGRIVGLYRAKSDPTTQETVDSLTAVDITITQAD